VPTVEERLARIERALTLGSEGGKLREDVQRLKISVAGLRNDKNIGNVLGGPIRTEIAPGSLPIGPYRQDLDATFDLSFTLWIPDYLLRIKQANLRLKPLAVRSSVAVTSSSEGTPSGGGSTSGASSASSTPSGGGSTSGAGASHSHLLPVTVAFAMVGNSGSAGTGATASPSDNTSQQSDEDPPTLTHKHGMSLHTHNGPNHTHGVGSFSVAFAGGQSATSEATHTHSTPNHTHGIEHTHSTPNHTHPSHSHALTLAIAESGMATDLELWIDGVDRTATLGGPWNAAVTLDIRQWLVNARQVPVAGAHAIVVKSASVGAAEVVGDIYGVIKAIQ